MTHKLIPDWKEKVVFADDGPKPQILEENERIKVVLAGLKPGQKIGEHPGPMGVYHFLQGNGWVTVNGERMAVSQGATVVMPQGATRGIEADTQLAFMAVRFA